MSEWIECGLPYLMYGEAIMCFTKAVGSQNLPGILIELEDGDRYLIGHINPERGVCDDCVEFDRHRIVKRYKRIWSPH